MKSMNASMEKEYKSKIIDNMTWLKPHSTRGNKYKICEDSIILQWVLTDEEIKTVLNGFKVIPHHFDDC